MSQRSPPMPDNLDLPALRAVAEAATPGPWEIVDPLPVPGDDRGVNEVEIAHQNTAIALVYGTDSFTCIEDDEEEELRPQMWANQRYIAAFSPPVVLRLLDAATEVDALRA